MTFSREGLILPVVSLAKLLYASKPYYIYTYYLMLLMIERFIVVFISPLLSKH